MEVAKSAYLLLLSHKWQIPTFARLDIENENLVHNT